MHYMVHFPDQIMKLVIHKFVYIHSIYNIYRFGPLVTSWCMRMEAKNSYFKKSARVANFKNIAYSVAKRHQKMICAYLQCSKFLFLMSYSVVHVSTCLHVI